MPADIVTFSSFDKLALAGPNVVAKHKPAKKELEHALLVGESDNPVGLGSLRMISYNVRSLSPGSLARAKAHGVNANLKLELLDEDLHKRGYDVVFLQEHGLGGDITRQLPHYVGLVSSAAEGRLGTAVWIHNRSLEVGKVRFAPISERCT